MRPADRNHFNASRSYNPSYGCGQALHSHIVVMQGFANLWGRIYYPPSQKATGVNPWMYARWVPFVALAKEGTLRRVPPYEACGEVPRP